MLGDYKMKILVIWQNNIIAESDVIIHVVDPLPTGLPVPGCYNYLVAKCSHYNIFLFHAVTFIQFSSSNYSVSSLDVYLKVTLTLSGQPQPEPFDVFVIAKDTLSANCTLPLLA